MNASGDSFQPGLHYFVGGNSKVYGAACSVSASAISAGFRRHVHGQRDEDPLDDLYQPGSAGPHAAAQLWLATIAPGTSRAVAA